MALSSVKETSDREAEEKNASFGSVQTRILIVDGDHSSMLTVHGMAKSFISRVDAANGVEAALDCLKKTRYDAVITDLEMGGASGYELARWIKGKSPETRAIIMAGRSHAEKEQYMNTGVVDHWIFKPFGRNDLLIALDGIVPKGLAALQGTG